MILDHYRAVQALLPQGLQSYLINVPGKPVYPYVVLWGSLGVESSGDDDGDSLGDLPRSFAPRIRATYVGLSPDSMIITAQRVRASLKRARPAVAGRACSKLRQGTLTDAQTDNDVVVDGQRPVYAVDEFTFVSDAA